MYETEKKGLFAWIKLTNNPLKCFPIGKTRIQYFLFGGFSKPENISSKYFKFAHPDSFGGFIPANSFLPRKSRAAEEENFFRRLI